MAATHTALIVAIPAAEPRFDLTLDRIGWFGDTVVWLTNPAHPFITLTAVTAHLPITTTVTAISLITGTPAPGATWRTLADLPLGH